MERGGERKDRAPRPHCKKGRKDVMEVYARWGKKKKFQNGGPRHKAQQQPGGKKGGSGVKMSSEVPARSREVPMYDKKNSRKKKKEGRRWKRLAKLGEGAGGRALHAKKLTKGS